MTADGPTLNDQVKALDADPRAFRVYRRAHGHVWLVGAAADTASKADADKLRDLYLAEDEVRVVWIVTPEVWAEKARQEADNS